MIVFIVTLICCASLGLATLRYESFPLWPTFWWNLRSYHAIRRKRFRRPLSSYGYKQLHSDEYGTLWRMPATKMKDIALIGGTSALWNHGVSMVRSRQYIVEVVDPSTQNRYYLAVPTPNAAVWHYWRSNNGHAFTAQKNWLDNYSEWRSAKAAVAWGFGMSEQEYSPVVQT